MLNAHAPHFNHFRRGIPGTGVMYHSPMAAHADETESQSASRASLTQGLVSRARSGAHLDPLSQTPRREAQLSAF